MLRKFYIAFGLLALFAIAALFFAHFQPMFVRAKVDSDRSQTWDRLQTALVQKSDSQKRIADDLASALADLPKAARIRVSLFRLRQDGTVQIDAVYGVAGGNYAVGDLSNDRPQNPYFQSLPNLLANKCDFVRVKNLSQEDRERLLPIVYYYRCPIMMENRLVGVASASWDHEADIPADSENQGIDDVMRKLTANIGRDIN